MREMLYTFTNIINDIHDHFLLLFKALGWDISDDVMHFWIIGICGFILFGGTQLLFKWLVRWGITAVSLFYSLTFITVLVILIEVQQHFTNRGNMEVSDAIMGLAGFLFFFGVYLTVKFINNQVKKAVDKRKNNKVM